MKKVFYITIVSAIIVFACKKQTPAPAPTPTPTPVPIADTVSPVLTLNGMAMDTVVLLSTYSDAGATALDNIDGNVTTSIVATGTVNTQLVGNYVITYSVQDLAGNAATASRSVHVKNSNGFIAGNYLVTCLCTTLNPGENPAEVNATYNYSITAAASTTANNFSINTLNIGTNVNVNNVLINVSNNTLSGYYQQANAAAPSLTGTLSATKTSFTIQTSHFVNDYPNKTIKCSNQMTKQ